MLKLAILHNYYFYYWYFKYILILILLSFHLSEILNAGVFFTKLHNSIATFNLSASSSTAHNKIRALLHHDFTILWKYFDKMRLSSR